MSVISLRPEQATHALVAPLAVVIPIYNEAETIQRVVSAWQETFERNRVGHQFILVNDGSNDSTWKVLRDMEKRHPDHLIIIDKPNAGHGRSCRLGYEAAIASPHVQWILQIDSDGQCDPAYFRSFWENKDQVDCVFGKRERRDDGFLRSLTSALCRMGATFLARQDMVDPNVPYRLMRKKALAAALPQIPASFEIHNVALTFVLKRDPSVKWRYIPIRFLGRQGGQNSIDLLNVMQLGFSMMFDLAKVKKKLNQA